MGWLALSIGFAVGLAFPLILLGAPKEAVWPIALVCGAILLAVRPGGTVERFMSGLFSYGLVFSTWCVLGVIVCIPLALVFSGFRAPTPLYVVLAFGLFGVIRELAKPPVQPHIAIPPEATASAAWPVEVSASGPLGRPEVSASTTTIPSPSSTPFDNTQQRREARTKVRRELGE